MFKQYKLKNYHFQLIIFITLLTVVGILVIGSAEESVQNKQIFGLIVSLFVMVLISLIDYTFLLKFAPVYYILSIVLLVLVQLKGESHGGAQRWIIIAGIQFQPSEVTKIALILFFSYLFMKCQEKLNTLLVLVCSFVLAGIPLALILKQPDTSTTIVTMLIFLVLLFVAGLSYKIIITVLAICIPSAILMISYILKKAASASSVEDVPYQIRRIMAWLYPDNPWYADIATQQQNSIMAIGSGQLVGKGLENSDSTSLLNGNYLSEAQTDFIFAVVGEELGFVGTLITIVLVLLIVLECILIGRKARDLSGRLICCGMAALVGLQSFVNIGVATGVLPNTGIPLPFVSYGLTSLVSLYIGMGVVLNVGLQPKSSYKGDNL